MTPDEMSKAERRTPAACPRCGATTAFGSLGKFTRHFQRHRIGEGDEPSTISAVYQRWWEFHCPECEATFGLVDTEDEHVTSRSDDV